MTTKPAEIDQLKDHEAMVIDDDTCDEVEEMSDETILEKMLFPGTAYQNSKDSTDASITDNSSVSSSCFANNFGSTASSKTSVDVSNNQCSSSVKSSSPPINKTKNPKFSLYTCLNDKAQLIGKKQSMESPVLETRICEGDEVYVLQLRGIKATIPRRKIGSWVNITRFKIVLSSSRFKSLKKDIAKCENKKYLKFPQWNNMYTGYWVSLDTARTLSIKYQIYNQLSPLLAFDNVAVTSYAGCKFYEYFVNLNPHTSIRILRKCENDWLNLIQLCDLYEAVNPEKNRFKSDYIASYQNSDYQFVQHNDQTLCGGIWIPIEDAYKFAIEFGLYSKLIYILTYNRGIEVPYIPDSKLNRRLKEEWKYFDKKCKNGPTDLLFGLPNDFKLNPNINRPNFKTLQNISHKYGAAELMTKKLFDKYKQYIKKYSRKSRYTSVRKNTKNFLSKILRLLSLAINLKENYLCHLGETAKVILPDLDKGVSLDHYLFRRYVDGHVNVSSLLRALIALRFNSHGTEDSDPEMQRENELFYLDNLNNLKTCSYIYVPNDIDNDFIAKYLHNPIIQENTSSKVYESLIDRYESLSYNWDHCINGKWVSVNTARSLVHDSYQTTFKGRHLDRINSLLYSKNFDEKNFHIKYHEDDFIINDDPFKDDSESDFECLEMRIRKNPRIRKERTKRNNTTLRSTLNEANHSYDTNKITVLPKGIISRRKTTESTSSAFEVIKFKKTVDYKNVLGYDPFTKDLGDLSELSDFELLDEEDAHDIQSSPCSDKNTLLKDQSPFLSSTTGLKPGVEVVDLDTEVQINDNTSKELHDNVSVKREDIDSVNFSDINTNQTDSNSPEESGSPGNSDKVSHRLDIPDSKMKFPNEISSKTNQIESKNFNKFDSKNDPNRLHSKNSSANSCSDSQFYEKAVSKVSVSGKQVYKVHAKNSLNGTFSVDKPSVSDRNNNIEENNDAFMTGNQKLEILSSDSSDSDDSDIIFFSRYSPNDNTNLFFLNNNNSRAQISSSILSKNVNRQPKFSKEDIIEHHDDGKSTRKTIDNHKEKHKASFASKDSFGNQKIATADKFGKNSSDYSEVNKKTTSVSNLTNSQGLNLSNFSKLADEWKTAKKYLTDIIELDYDDETSSDDGIIMEYTRGTVVRYNNSHDNGNSNQTHLTYFYSKNDKH